MSSKNCSICTNPYKEAVVLIKCGHSYCKSCILQWLVQANSCPHCRQIVDSTSRIFIPNYALRNASSETKEDEDGIENFCDIPQDYDIKTDDCVICKRGLSKPCITCESNNLNNCFLAVGKCSHIYHYHCVRRWSQIHSVCPLGKATWSIDTNKTDISLLPRMITVNLGESTSLKFEDIPASQTMNQLAVNLQSKIGKSIRAFIYRQKRLNGNSTVGDIDDLSNYRCPCIFAVFDI